MQITVEISDQEAARAAELGLTPEAYIRDLLTRDSIQESEWITEVMRRSEAIDVGSAKVIAWEEIEARLRSRLAS